VEPNAQRSQRSDRRPRESEYELEQRLRKEVNEEVNDAKAAYSKKLSLAKAEETA